MALTITKAEVVEVAPELADTSIDNGVWATFLSFAADEVGNEIPDQSSKDRCGRYLVAHFITQWKRSADGVSANGQPAGPLSAVKVGEISKNYAVPEAYTKAALSDAALMTTKYGVEFLRLIRLYMGGSFMVSGGLGPVGGFSPWGC